MDEDSCAEDAASLGDFSENNIVEFARDRLQKLRQLTEWTPIDDRHLPPVVMVSKCF